MKFLSKENLNIFLDARKFDGMWYGKSDGEFRGAIKRNMIERSSGTTIALRYSSVEEKYFIELDKDEIQLKGELIDYEGSRTEIVWSDGDEWIKLNSGIFKELL